MILARHVQVVLAVVLAAGCTTAPPPMAEPSATASSHLPSVAASDLTLRQDSAERAMRRSVVRVRNTSCAGVGSGTGFFLASDVIATNRHVVDRGVWLEVSTWDGRSRDVEVAGVAVDSDLAVVLLSEPVANVNVPEFGKFSRGADVAVVGFPLGGEYQVSSGTVVDTVAGRAFGDAATVIRIDATVRRGNSGGPLFDANGSVVGIVFAVEAATGYGLALDVDALLDRRRAAAFVPNRDVC